MKKLFALVGLTMFFFLLPQRSFAANNPTLISGAQIASDKAIPRLSDSQLNFDWVKYQYSLGSEQPVSPWINNGHNGGFQILLSVAKNKAGIRNLDSSDATETGQWCPWDDELRMVPRTRSYVDALGVTHNETYYVREDPPKHNGYMDIRDRMKELADRLKSAVPNGNGIPDAIEIWNEPNLAVEWTDQNPSLGEVNPDHYAKFFYCAVKGLKKAGYTGKILTAGLAPTQGDDKNMNDKNFFYAYYDKLESLAGQPDGTAEIRNISFDDFFGVGWHSNVPANIPPDTPFDQNEWGFQRAKIAIDKTEARSKQVWLTEYGWPRDDPTYAKMTKSGVTKELQNAYIADAYRVAFAMSYRLTAMFVFNFGWTKDGGSPQPEQTELERWDIEAGVDATKCVVGEGKTTSGFDKAYVAQLTTKDDAVIMKDLQKGTQPPEINKSTTDMAEQNFQQETDKQTRITIKEAFFKDLQKQLSSLFEKLVPCGSILGIQLRTCTPGYAMGEHVDQADQDIYKDETQKLVKTTEVVSQGMIPTNLKVKGALKDCNIVPEGSTGDTLLDNFSGRSGTKTGVYSQYIYDFKDLDDCIQKLKKQEDYNLIIDNKQLTGDERDPDKQCRKLLWWQSYWPSNVKPEYMPIGAQTSLQDIKNTP